MPAGGGRRRREVEEEDLLLTNQHIFTLLDHNPPQLGDDVEYGKWASKDEKLVQEFFSNDPASNSSAWLSTLRDLAQQLAKWKKGEDSLETSLSSAETNRTNIDNDEDSCLVSTWRCMSAVLEGGISCFQSPGKFQR